MGLVAGERRDHLVGIHVGGRPGAGLEGVHRELLIVLAGGDALTGGGDALGEIAVEETEVGVHPGGRRLDPTQPMDHLGHDRLARHGEILHRLRRLPAPQLPLLLNPHGSPKIVSPNATRRPMPARAVWAMPLRRYPQKAASSRATPTGSS